jgi:hypothetical protein
MKKLLLLALVVLLAVAGPVSAQTLIQQSPTLLNACSVSNQNGAVNAQKTVTLTPQSGQYVYVCGLDFQVTNDATGAVTQANVCFTSTNLGPAGALPQWCYSAINALNTSALIGQNAYYYPFPLKSQTPGTAVTIVSPAANLHAAYNVNVYYYYAP